MRFLQILIVVVILLSIVLTIVFLQDKNKPQRNDEQPSASEDESAVNRSAKIFIFVIGISIAALCTTVVVFHMLG